MYLIVDNNSVLARDYAQMSGRIRDVAEVHIFVRMPAARTKLELTVEAVKHRLRCFHQAHKNSRHGINCGEEVVIVEGRLTWRITEDWFFLLVCYNTAEANLSQYRMLDSIVWFVKDMGGEPQWVDRSHTPLPEDGGHDWARNGDLPAAEELEIQQSISDAKQRQSEADKKEDEQIEERVKNMDAEERLARLRGTMLAREKLLLQFAVSNPVLKQPTFALMGKLEKHSSHLRLLEAWARPDCEDYLKRTEHGLGLVPLQDGKNKLLTRIEFLQGLAGLLLAPATEGSTALTLCERFFKEEISSKVFADHQVELTDHFQQGYSLWAGVAHSKRSIGLLKSKKKLATKSLVDLVKQVTAKGLGGLFAPVMTTSGRAKRTRCRSFYVYKAVSCEVEGVSLLSLAVARTQNMAPTPAGASSAGASATSSSQ
eukprot:gb/GEZN01007363.1/.p1 GENE.gb/GEZN01007363.1/~~gb/GEZN01007363.1/.p1  ORF type:complete len:455 (+),score=55.80 gb/GEZN01007363.1/:86-1366(+)